MCKAALVLVLVSVLSGCATSANMQVGNDQSYLSLQDQRTATETIQITDTVPGNAVVIGNVEATRCHRNFTEKVPAEAVLTRDLQVNAYAAGADGITDIEITTQIVTALLKNCWKTITGTATAYDLKKPEDGGSESGQ